MESMDVGVSSVLLGSCRLRHGALRRLHGTHGPHGMRARLLTCGFACFQANCQRVAETAPAEGNRQRWLAILHDEVGLHAL